MELNKRILNHILNNGIKISEIARKTGISRQNLDRIFSSNDIKMSQYYSICESLNLEPNFFLSPGDPGDHQIPNIMVELLTHELHLNALKGKALVFLGYNEVNSEFFTKYKKLESPLDIEEFEKFEKAFERDRKKSISDIDE